jgi:murein DD-endopeptidase MepM/ murein hydrolase activator NlpD
MQVWKEILADKRSLIFLTCTYSLIALLLLLHLVTALLPWLHDGEAPLVNITGISQRNSYRGMMAIEVNALDRQTVVKDICFYLDGELLERSLTEKPEVNHIFRLNTDVLSEGNHLLKIAAADASLFAHTSVSKFEIVVDRTPPSLSLQIGTASAFQGDTLSFFVRSSEGLSLLKAELFGKTLLFFVDKHNNLSYRSLIGIPALQMPHSFGLTFKAIDMAGNESVVSYAISVKAKKFHQEKITLSPQKAGLLTDYQAVRRDYEKRNAAFKVISSRQLWQGRFIEPTIGRVTSPFGEQRVFNNTVYSVHAGIDIANKEGTPIAAANSGVVLLAENIPLHGNAVIIDHGQGVHTMYAHMKKIIVQANAMVKKGAIIGFMGDTGLTTGPHLHWEMRVNNVAINPLQWTETAFEFP